MRGFLAAAGWVAAVVVVGIVGGWSGNAALGAPAAAETAVAQWAPTLLPGLCGSPPFWCGRQARAINGRGQIVGLAHIEPEYESDYHAVLWQAGRIRDLGTLGGRVSLAEDINDRGQVVGWSYIGPRHAHRAFIWQSGRMRNLGTLPGPYPNSEERDSEALALNEAGQVVGDSTVWRADKWLRRAVVWETGRIRELGTLPGHDVSGATGINERGDVIGWSAKRHAAGIRDLQAVLWRNGQVRRLGITSTPSAINDRGEITTLDGTYWAAGKKRSLCQRVGVDCSATSINNHGWIVGNRDLPPDADRPQQGILWQGQQPYRFRAFGFVDINDAGEILEVESIGHGQPDGSSVWRVKR